MNHLQRHPLLHDLFRPFAALAILVCALTGCAPTINLATPEPVKVDVAIRLDVYQKTNPGAAKQELSSIEIVKNRRLREGEVQGLKNNGIVGEDRDGYLSLRVDLKDPKYDPKYVTYVEGIIAAENADRAYIYLANAQSQNKPLEMIETEYARLWRERAFPGEWVQKENGSWTQK